MNAQSAVFSLVSIQPHAIRDMIKRFPYSSKTVYRAVEELGKEGMVVKSQREGKTTVSVSDGYRPQKLREIYVQSLSFGIDPEALLRTSTMAVWKAIDTPKTLEDIRQETGLSERWIRKTLKTLARHGLARYEKRRPIVAVRDESHTLNRLLKAFKEERRGGEAFYYSGTSPFEEIVTTPEEIERILYHQIKGSLTVKDTGFLVRGEDEKLTVLESVEKEPTIEEMFLMKLNTPEGVEDACIRIVASRKLDYQRLLLLAKERYMVNVVGCYLEILNDIKELIEPEVIKDFEKHKSKRRRMFLTEEKRYGKGGWEEEYERKWNLDLYIDLGTIRHGIRST